jgi:phosphate transport system substrate-binding protein
MTALNEKSCAECHTAVLRAGVLVVAVALCLVAGCTGKKAGGAGHLTIQNKGSDTIVNLAQGWAEAYKKAAPEVSVEVSGGGSGVGIAALIKGTIDIANSSRDIKASEIEDAKRSTGQEPRDFIIGFDALAIYVHKDNPIESITFEQLAGIYAEGGRLTQWSDLGVSLPSRRNKIIRISRQSSSGTYEFFRERVLNNRDFKLGSNDMNGSKEVVELVANTPGAIGYSGMGYANEHVKVLRVAAIASGTAFAPTVENTLSGDYPIARSLHLLTLGEPEGIVKTYLDWVRSAPGQEIVAQCGFVPIPAAQRTR